MDRNVDNVMKKLAANYNENTPLTFMRRFLDDIFLVFTGSTESLHALHHEINKIHPNIRFTITHTTPKTTEPNPCKCEILDSVPFLDTECKIKEGQIITDLFRKPTDKNQYLMTSSCHPAQCVENIPYSLALRITRICSEPEARENRFIELKEMLNNREYTPKLVDAAIAKARAVTREVALREVSRQPSTNRPVYVVRYDPRLPDIPNIVTKHWRSMVSQDNYLQEVFEEPPLIAYKRNTNIKDMLIRAKITKNTQRQKRKQRGMKKCGKCVACSSIKEGRTIKSNKFTWTLNKQFNCKTENVVYLLECDKEYCKQQYIGETERKLRERIKEHIGYAKNKMIHKTTGNHFNLPGHSWLNMKFTVIEQVKSTDRIYREEREKHFIKQFNTYYDGINKMP